MSAPLSLGIDIGGTFTDVVIHDPRDGRAVIWKESTTPDDPSRGAMEGTRRVLDKAGAKPEQIGRVVHATTLFTNALIERKGARTGLLTTASPWWPTASKRRVKNASCAARACRCRSRPSN